MEARGGTSVTVFPSDPWKNDNNQGEKEVSDTPMVGLPRTRTVMSCKFGNDFILTVKSDTKNTHKVRRLPDY